MAVNVKGLRRHTLCRITWFDVIEDNTGDPSEAHLVKRATYSMFWGQRRDRDSGIMSLVFTTTKDSDDQSQVGWLCIPKALVKKLEIIQLPEEDKDGDD
jgi:hypothetical protein